MHTYARSAALRDHKCKNLGSRHYQPYTPIESESDIMGTVAATLKVMPSSTDVNLGKIREEIEKAVGREKDVKLQSIEEKPIAFGLKALYVLLIMPDTHGTDNIEKSISSIHGVESVEAGDVTLL